MIVALGLAGKVHYTVLRGGFFNGNLIPLLAKAKETHQVALPDVWLPCVDPRDIGRVAAAIAASSDLEHYHGQHLEISGPERFPLRAIVEKVARLRGKPIAFNAVPAASLTFLPAFMRELFAYLEDAGEQAVPLSTAVGDIAGRHTSLDDWLAEHAQHFAVAVAGSE